MAIRFEACVKCTDRTVGCHGSCLKYLNDKAEAAMENERIRRIKMAEKDITSYECEAREKAYRRKGKL